ncbi:condensin complex subunit 3-like [Stylophora pistillata]|uniref:Condensin complex subunit 3 n=1 Tax=Stylophora pistillata TaxID=50429 RepID=A0A2B4SAV4_STYPI|nr:condensin complex subunit 3-like [Stylophora pistillata]PFX25708.1 Condensin complex subunit 3 [Stylophora pistillata]
MPSRYDSVRSVFEEAQRSFQQHKILTELKKLHDKSSPDEFLESFLLHLKHAMVVFNREPAVERVIEFVAKYATLKDHRTSQTEKDGDRSDGEEDDYSNVFLDSIFTFLLDSHDVKDKAVRFRVCQLINKLLNNMGDDAVIDDDLAERIFESMLIRLHDKFPAVRVQAVAAISRLQDPSDPECIVISTYLKLMSNDSSVEVRRTVLLNVALTSQTLEGIIGRTQDMTESVRKLAYRTLAEKVNIKSFTIAQRVQLLSNGLHDRSEAVKEVCAKELLYQWLNSFDGDVVKLLKCLDVDGCTEVAELALKTLLNGLPNEDLQGYIDSLKKGQQGGGPVEISYEVLDAETVFYWRCLGEHLKSMGVNGEALLDELLPEVSVFCKYIQGYVDNCLSKTSSEESDHSRSQQNFVTKQLLILVGVMDLSDEVGRKNLCQMIHDLLVHAEIQESLVDVLHDRYIDVQPEESSRIQELVEIIADVRQPIVMIETAQNKEKKRLWELKVAGMSVKLNQLRDEMEQCVMDQDFAKAAELKEQIADLGGQKEILDSQENSFSQTIREEKDDPDTLLKCLTIASEMLQGVATSGLNPTLTTLVQTLILPGVQNEDPLVRNMAVKCLGLCALLSCEFARTHLVLFLQVAQLDQELVRATALQVVFDLLLKFGLEAFKVNASVPEIEGDDPSINGSDQDKLEVQNDENEGDEDVTEKSDDGDVEETQAPDTDTAASVLTILTGILESESNDLRNVAAEGLAKLLLSGRVLSAKLFSRLLLLWYNPTTEDDVNLRHCLGVFFPVFAFASRTNQELIEEAFLPTLKTLFSAPMSSPLASVNINNVAELLVDLTNAKYLEKKEKSHIDANEAFSIHASLSIAMANEILSCPDAPGVRVLCKVLTMMDLTGCTQSTVKEIKVLTMRMIEEIEENMSLKSLSKLNKMLETLTDKEIDGVSQNESDDDNQANAEKTEEPNEDKPSEVLNENQADNKSKETKSRRKSKKQAGSNSVARDKEHGPIALGKETPARQTRSSRKSKTNVSKMVKSVMASEDDDSNEKENVSSIDTDDVFL